MDDLSQRDFSQKRVEDLSQVERQELRRRFEEFVTVMRGRRLGAGTAPPPKPVTKWDPAVHGRKH